MAQLVRREQRHVDLPRRHRLQQCVEIAEVTASTRHRERPFLLARRRARIAECGGMSRVGLAETRPLIAAHTQVEPIGDAHRSVCAKQKLYRANAGIDLLVGSRHARPRWRCEPMLASHRGSVLEVPARSAHGSRGIGGRMQALRNPARRGRHRDDTRTACIGLTPLHRRQRPFRTPWRGGGATRRAWRTGRCNTSVVLSRRPVSGRSGRSPAWACAALPVDARARSSPTP